MPALSRDSKYFKHQPLDSTRQDIRLIRLLRPTRKKPISCILEHLDIDRDRANVPSYTALSYTWGDEQALYTIHINGLPFMVRKNLHSFLTSRTELREIDVWLWIDQLCINQEDVVEKNHQVTMMAEIYSQAQSVIVWLGEAGPHTRAAIHILGELPAFWDKHGQHIVSRRGRSAIDYSPQGWSESLRSFEQYLNVSFAYGFTEDDGWSGVVDLLHRPYWSRLWVVQELFLSQNIALMCGTCQCALDFTEYGSNRLFWWLKLFLGTYARQVCSLDVTFSNDWSWLLDSCSERRVLESAGASGLLPLSLALSLSSDRECLDPRDIIYGLQACILPEQRIPIDYSLTASEIFALVADKLVTFNRQRYEEHDSFATLIYNLGELYERLGVEPAIDASIMKHWEAKSTEAFRGIPCAWDTRRTRGRHNATV
jgi:hypothetical protein